MCGITGLANLETPVELDGYYKAHLRLRHRGRDDEGFYALSGGEGELYRGDDTFAAFADLPHIDELAAANIVLGHRRLSIIDLSPGGHQPMQDPSGRFIISYNGEIYNYLELRRELIGRGHIFHTESDTEVVLAALGEWGLDCFGRFNGMWAMVIYDSLERRLLLSRDRFGIKPLYYAQLGSLLVFSSEVKFILPFLPELRMNEQRAVDYLARGLVDHHVETIFAGVYQLPPAHVAVWRGRMLESEAYWRLPVRRRSVSLEQASTELEELLTSAVALRLRSDVPVGSLLSGGLDSTTVVCLVRRLREPKSAANGFELFSAVFEEEAFSERPYVEETSAKTGLPVRWVYARAEDLVVDLPDLLYHQEFPFCSLSVYSQWRIMEAVRQTPIRVLLNGQGSDEIFGGYTHHYFVLMAEYLRRGQPLRAVQLGLAFAEARQTSPLQPAAKALYQLTKASPLNALLRLRPFPYLNSSYHAPELWHRQRDIFTNDLVRNLTFSSLPEYLRYEDRNSMAFTLESRLPYLDYRVVEWAMSLPHELRIKGASSKLVLRTMAEPLIPSLVNQRTDKMGFTSPQELWQRTRLRPFLDAVFARDLEGTFPFLNGQRVRETYRRYQDGENNDWKWIWRLACLAEWHRSWWTLDHDT